MASTRETGVFTVAAVRQPRGKDATQVLLNEYQSIFTLATSGRAATAQTAELRSAARRRTPLKVVLDTRRGVIQRLSAPSATELEEFRRDRTLLDKPERTVRIDVATIDPSVFNVVDHHLRARIFRLCKRIVPSYKRAKQIFDFCAAQSCHLGAPTVPPCIPFQYVRDGCHARAHQMRKIIDHKYGYCVEKVFSFANQGSDTLRVRADKWGGCCVAWWFHVAPFLRVRLRLGRFSIVLGMVIDPSMFNKPVLLSTWLSAQANATCGPNAKVSMYSIQPWTAYTPASYAGTSFTTDPTYTKTNTTLNNYKNLTTCP